MRLSVLRVYFSLTQGFHETGLLAAAHSQDLSVPVDSAPAMKSPKMRQAGVAFCFVFPCDEDLRLNFCLLQCSASQEKLAGTPEASPFQDVLHVRKEQRQSCFNLTSSVRALRLNSLVHESWPM
jgi:hypothetical protein